MPSIAYSQSGQNPVNSLSVQHVFIIACSETSVWTEAAPYSSVIMSQASVSTLSRVGITRIRRPEPRC